MDIKRRTFIKALGLAGAGSVLPGCEREVHRLVPYLLPDDEIVPGVANWYASTCRECEAGCGVTVRVMEGRAKKIEGNPDHPLNRGKLCARGQAALQGLYNPDRLRGPLRRIGKDDQTEWIPMTWEDAIQDVSEHVRSAGERVIMISRPLSGTLGWLMSSFMRSIGGRLFYHDPGAELPLRAAMRHAYGTDTWPHYDLAHADHVVSFGAPFLDHWLSPVSYGIAYGHMRQGRPTRRGRFVQIEPRLSLTAANADEWIPARPGTEGLVAMGIGQVLLSERPPAWGTAQRKAYDERYHAIPLDRIAALTDVPRERLIRLARAFASAAAPLAFGGGPALAQTNATETLLLINGLNAIAGVEGTAGGVQLYRPPEFDAGPPVPYLTTRELSDFAAGTQKAPAVWLLYDTDPLFSTPPAVPLRRVLDRADYVASFSPFLDDSTAMADVILPDHSSLETWGDHVPPLSAPAQVVSLQQPAVMPLYDTRAVGDTLLQLASRLDLSGFSWPDFASLLHERWRTLLASERRTPREEGVSTDAAWIRSVQQGGWWTEPAPDQSLPAHAAPSAYTPARFDGEPEEFPFHLLPYPSVSLGHGRSANLPWLQQLPDPLTTVMWGSWAEINPATARELGLTQGERIRLHSRHGTIEVPAVFFPGIRPDVVAVPIGQGHGQYGRYAGGRGANPLSVVAPLFDRRSGALATGGTRIRIERTGERGPLVLAEKPAIDPGKELLTIMRSRPGV